MHSWTEKIVENERESDDNDDEADGSFIYNAL